MSGDAGLVVWITGLSGAGKTTVARELIRLLDDQQRRPVLLDGDEMRSALGNAGLDAASRRSLALAYARLCRLLARQGHTVVCATISLLREVHDWNRRYQPDYVEVLLDVPAAEIRRRDPKGIYRSAGQARTTVGVGLSAEFPVHPDLTIANHGPTSSRRAAQNIFDYGTAKGLW